VIKTEPKEYFGPVTSLRTTIGQLFYAIGDAIGSCGGAFASLMVITAAVWMVVGLTGFILSRRSERQGRESDLAPAGQDS
jgi:hypothetical protein